MPCLGSGIADPFFCPLYTSNLLESPQTRHRRVVVYCGTMFRNLLVLLATSTVAIAQNAGAPSRVCVYDGLKYNTLISAMNDCGQSGTAVIPPSYNGQDPANAKNPQIWDFRHPESVKRLTPVTDFGVKGDAA